MILRPLLITLMLVKRCQSDYNHESHEGPNFINQFENAARQPIQYQDNFEIYNPPVIFRRHEDSKPCHSGSTEECVCSCDECYQPKTCCRYFCKKCSAPGGNTDSDIYQLPYPSQSHSNVVVIPYPVPVLIFPIKTLKSVKSTNEITKVNNSEIGSPNSSQDTESPITIIEINTETSQTLEETTKPLEETDKTPEETQNPSEKIDNISEEPQKQSEEIEKAPEETEKPPDEIKTIPEDPQKSPEEIDVTPEKPENPLEVIDETPVEPKKPPEEFNSTPEEPQKPSKDIDKTPAETTIKSGEIETAPEEIENQPEKIEKTTGDDEMLTEITLEPQLPNTAPQPNDQPQKSSEIIQQISQETTDSQPVRRARLRLPYHIPSWIRKLI